MTPRGELHKYIKNACQFKMSELDKMLDLTLLDSMFNLLLALPDNEESELVLIMIGRRFHSIWAVGELNSHDTAMVLVNRIHLILRYFIGIRVLSDEPIVNISNINEYSIIIYFQLSMHTASYQIVLYRDKVTIQIHQPYEENCDT